MRTMGEDDLLFSIHDVFWSVYADLTNLIKSLNQLRQH
ncbi:hypothetical protein SCARR_03509 [Pontiella sulfatireligans]|uniref:Uncharacterized protein n=1 Tax=Pontiella sulfatireligans TaxID=2750658 RepID=A0A6C2UR46_9BACT|nr:hypothetical protein SCARR_03509 [Pontiella sulfatireligans]